MKLICACVTRNRGTGSKTDGSSFLINTLDSFAETIGCPFSLLIVNDDSNDDTLTLLCDWSDRHCGEDVLPLHSKICVHHSGHRGIGGSMNEYVLPLAGPDDIIVRFDDDIKFLNPGWGQRGLDSFAKNPELVSLGGLQIDPREFVHSFGDRIIGPCYRHLWARSGYHGFARPTEEDQVLYPVQSVMGAFCAFRASALKEIGGYDPQFYKLRCETEDVHVSFMERGWETAVRFGLDIMHWSDRRIAHAREEKAWGVEHLDEKWLAKWRFMRTGLTLENEWNQHLSAMRVSQLMNHPCENIRKRLNDLDSDEVPGMIGANTRCWLPAFTPVIP